MITRKTGLTAILALIAFSAGLSAVAEARVLSGAQLRALLGKGGVYTAWWKKKKARVQLFSNGTLRAQYTNKIDVGRWSIRGNVMCVSFRVWTHGRPKCGTVVRQGSWLVGLKNSRGIPRLRLKVR